LRKVAVAISASEFNRKVKAAQRKAEQDQKRQVAGYNRKVEAHNRRVVTDYNRAVQQHNRRADANNKKVIDEIYRRLAVASRPQVVARYTPAEQELVDRLHDVVPIDDREHDLFCSYARIDGAHIAQQLHAELEALELRVWIDDALMHLGKSVARQIDQGLCRARAGIAVLTPAYLTGRFWTERELGALLHKETLIPVLHGVTFDDVRQYSGILPDLLGFTTRENSVPEIAMKIASAMLDPS
jgi:hypothetical protein